MGEWRRAAPTAGRLDAKVEPPPNFWFRRRCNFSKFLRVDLPIARRVVFRNSAKALVSLTAVSFENP